MKPKVNQPSCPMALQEDDLSSTPATSAVNSPEAQIVDHYTSLQTEIPLRQENPRHFISSRVSPMEPVDDEEGSQRNSYCRDPELRLFLIAGTIVVGGIVLALIIVFFHFFGF
ncbi:uncharacterized protein [Parasteatoda tepidariorum]|uniref:uncharacterized protein n=1 Tax=Parasteatoda tepidariorum TaxID=114398 RepID=UPI0039BD4928